MSLAVKSGRPLSREGLVPRPRLLAKLTDGRSIPLVVIVAPAGYGKTSLLAEWTEQDERPSVWLSLEAWHNDPFHLTREIAVALEELEPVEAMLVDALDAPAPDLGSLVLPALARTLESRTRPVLLILDDAHSLTSQPALRVLTTVAEHLPFGSQLIFASRALPALPLGRLRAHRALLELGTSEMAMGREEAAALLHCAHVSATAAEVDALVEQTEGWPAGLYLAALSARDAPDSTALVGFSGDDRVVAEYLWDEFLSELVEDDVDFLVNTSIAEHLSGVLCDALLDSRGSAHTLDRLARGSLPLEPTDRTRSSYRCHPLLRDALLGELRRIHPEREPLLHMRASLHHTEHGEIDSAITHAMAAHDAQRAGRLLWAHLPRYISEGRTCLVQSWLHSLSPEDFSLHASLALTAAYSALALGDVPHAEHWGLVAAAAIARASTPPSPSSLSTGVAVIEAAIARRGIAPMGLNAARAYELEDDDSPWRSICCLLQGVAHHLTGDGAGARSHLEEGIHRSAVVAPPVEMLCLSQLAMIAVEEKDWDRGLDLIARAVQQIEHHSLSAHPASALAYAISADVRSHAGHVDDGKRDARHAAHLLNQLGDFIPWYEAQTRIMLARATLRLADVIATRTLLAQASQLARRVPDAVLLGAWLDETWGLVDSVATAALAGPAALTMAELRILRFLPTHLSFREIGIRLHVSTNTVKTQAHAIYRKLDVSSRSDAVARAAQIGLLRV